MSFPTSMNVHSMPSFLYSSCSSTNTWWLKNCCSFSLVKLMHSCSRLLSWVFRIAKSLSEFGKSSGDSAKQTQSGRVLWGLSLMPTTHMKDLKASDVQDPDEELPGLLGVQLLVDAGDHPQEHLLVDGFGQGSHFIVHLHRQSNDRCCY